MNRDELRRVQSPLKDRYKEDADAAMITLHASGELGSEDVSCSVEAGRAMVEAGLHPASGGDGSLACSGDMLLQALVACAGGAPRSVGAERGGGGRSLALASSVFVGCRGSSGPTKARLPTPSTRPQPS